MSSEEQQVLDAEEATGVVQAYENSKKLFLGNLHTQSDEEYKDKLKTFFGTFGEVIDLNIIIDKDSGISRGFAFITFADANVAEQVLGDHEFEGKVIQARTATRRGPGDKHRGRGRHMGFDPNGVYMNPGMMHAPNIFLPPNAVIRNTTGKIFVGGLPRNLAEEELKEYFSKFGEITEAIILYDQTTKNSRGFGFITFKDERAVDELLSFQQEHELGGKTVEVKRATPRKDTPRNRVMFDKGKGGKGPRNRHIYGRGNGNAGMYNPNTYYDQTMQHNGQPGYVQHFIPPFSPHYPNQQGFVPMPYYGGYGMPNQGHPMSPSGQGYPSMGPSMSHYGQFPPPQVYAPQYGYPDHGEQVSSQKGTPTNEHFATDQRTKNLSVNNNSGAAAMSESLIGASMEERTQEQSTSSVQCKPSPLTSMGDLGGDLPGPE